MKIAQRYENKPHQWNLTIMIAVGGLLWSALAFYINVGVVDHSNSPTSHPTIVQQLNRMESNQIESKIESMDNRLCGDPGNRYYRSELRRLITEWESLTGKKYPTQLLRCANGTS